MVAAAVIVLYASCGGGVLLEQQEEFQSGSGNSEQAVFYQEHKKRRFKMCWIQDSAATQPQRDRVKQVVLSEYAKTPIQFYGFGTCTDDIDAAYRIHIFDNPTDNPRVAEVGRSIKTRPMTTDGVTWHMRLNLSFEERGTLCKDPRYLDNCITSNALHEFGHLLGRVHEHAHRNSTCVDFRHKERIGRFRSQLPYDPDSIMNYCRGGDYTYARITRRLSPGDLSAFWMVYGKHFGTGYARVTHREGTAIKRKILTQQPRERCALSEGSSFKFKYLGTYDNHIKVKILDPHVQKACASKLRWNMAFLYPDHFSFWK